MNWTIKLIQLKPYNVQCPTQNLVVMDGYVGLTDMI